jgi:hypothetical protein
MEHTSLPCECPSLVQLRFRGFSAVVCFFGSVDSSIPRLSHAQASAEASFWRIRGVLIVFHTREFAVAPERIV